MQLCQTRKPNYLNCRQMGICHGFSFTDQAICYHLSYKLYMYMCSELSWIKFMAWNCTIFISSSASICIVYYPVYTCRWNTFEQHLSTFNTMAQIVRGNRLLVYVVVAIIGAIFLLGAVLLLLLVPSIRSAVFSFVLCISVVYAIVYMAKGGSFGTQVFALLTIVVVVLLTFPTIITPNPELHFIRVRESLVYYVAVGFLMVVLASWCRPCQRVYIPYPQAQPGQLPIDRAH